MIECQKKALEDIFRAGLKAVDPERAVRKYVRCEGNQLFVGDCSYSLDRFKRILLIGAGKGTAPMAKAQEDILGDWLTSGWIIVKYGHGMPLEKTHIMEAGHPIPDEAGLKATREIADQLITKLYVKVIDLTEEGLEPDGLSEEKIRELLRSET